MNFCISFLHRFSLILSIYLFLKENLLTTFPYIQFPEDKVDFFRIGGSLIWEYDEKSTVIFKAAHTFLAQQTQHLTFRQLHHTEFLKKKMIYPSKDTKSPKKTF